MYASQCTLYLGSFLFIQILIPKHLHIPFYPCKSHPLTRFCPLGAAVGLFSSIAMIVEESSPALGEGEKEREEKKRKEKKRNIILERR